jgi:hypothetical protein
MPVPGDLGKVLAAVACGVFVSVAKPVIRIALPGLQSGAA